MNPLQTPQQNAAAKKESSLTAIESALIKGDLAPLSTEQRLEYYNKVCESVGLNPLTTPFNYVQYNGKIVLYANKSCAEQLRRNGKISCRIKSRDVVGDILTVTGAFTDPSGREDEASASIFVGGLRGDMLANAHMKCETKMKRRGTLSFCGLSFADVDEDDDKIVQAPMPRQDIHKETAKENSDAAPTEEKPKPAEKFEPNTAQLKRLNTIAGQRGDDERPNWMHAGVLEFIKEMWGLNSTKELNLEQYNTLCDKILPAYTFEAAMERLRNTRKQNEEQAKHEPQ